MKQGKLYETKCVVFLFINRKAVTFTSVKKTYNTIVADVSVVSTSSEPG